jgi:hypothetical protein
MKIYRPTNDRKIKITKQGGPRKYTKALADNILFQMSNGRSLTSKPEMPTYSTVMSWIWQESEYQEYFSKIFPLNLGVAMILSRLILTIFFSSGRVWQVSPVIPNKWAWH